MHEVNVAFNTYFTINHLLKLTGATFPVQVVAAGDGRVTKPRKLRALDCISSRGQEGRNTNSVSDHTQQVDNTYS